MSISMSIRKLKKPLHRPDKHREQIRSEMESLKKKIKAEAASLGFSFTAFTHPACPPHYQQYRDWISRGYAGEMTYLESSRAVSSRNNPAELLTGAMSMIVLGFPYKLIEMPSGGSLTSNNPTGRIASYALYPDYHKVLRQKTAELIKSIDRISGVGQHCRTFIDSSSIMEKDSAYMAGAGWIGKNTLLLTPDYGSCQFIACILTDLVLPPDQSYPKDLCGDCRQCLDACPTGCLGAEHSLKANECIAYLTIEFKGIIPRHLRQSIGKRIFGCDACQMVCPRNKDAQISFSTEMKTLIIDPEPDLIREFQLTPEEFTAKYRNTPVLRAGFESFKRNVIVALGNSRSPAGLTLLEEVLNNDPSWLLRLHAAWAIGMIGGSCTSQVLVKAMAVEQDPRARAELSLWLTKDQLP